MNLSAFFALGFALASVILTVTGAPAPVLDVAGQEIEVGVPYEIWSVGSGVIRIGNSQGCPKYVIRAPLTSPSTPIPVGFHPTNCSVNTTDSVVRIGHDYNFVFHCVGVGCSNVWKVNLDTGSKDYNFITTGGGLGCDDFNAWFQIVAVQGTNSHHYKLTNRHVCIDYNCSVDIKVMVNGEERLYLNHDHDYKTLELKVWFKRHRSTILQVI